MKEQPPTKPKPVCLDSIEYGLFIRFNDAIKESVGLLRRLMKGTRHPQILIPGSPSPRPAHSPCPVSQDPISVGALSILIAGPMVPLMVEILHELV